MTLESHRVRRATLDDLPVLRSLWSSMQFPIEDLERRLTEFQVVEAADGKIAGAIGIQILRPHAWLHCEAYENFDVANELRPLLMRRIQSLAANHGVFRLWTREKSPFWIKAGFQPPTPEILRKLPSAWTEHGSGWLTLQLKDEETISSMEKELALFMESEKLRTQRAMGQVRAFKSVATFIALVLGLLILIAIVYLIRTNPGILAPPK